MPTAAIVPTAIQMPVAEDQRQGVEVHAEEAGDQVQRQEHGRQHGQRAHDVVGAMAQRREVHLHRDLGRMLEPAHVRQHAFDVFVNVARAQAQQFALRGAPGWASAGHSSSASIHSCMALRWSSQVSSST